MQDMIESYKNTRRRIRALRTLSTDKAERESYGESLSDIAYILEWISSGRRPGGKRGIELRYRVRLWDPKWIEQYHSQNSGITIERDTTIRELPEPDRKRINEVMHDLTDRERECFVLHHVDGMTFEEIGMELHIGRSTVQKYIERAREKIEHGKVYNHFLF